MSDPTRRALIAKKHIRRVTLKCGECGKDFDVCPSDASSRKFCGCSCAARWRMRVRPLPPEHYRQLGAKLSKRLKGRARPDTAERMRQNNPTRNPATVEKMRRSLTGRTFLARGGNGKLTKPQILVADAMGLPTEYAIRTTGAEGVSLPPCYKVDLAIPSLKIAIEIDGQTHKQKKWRFLDQRKTKALESLGWSVLRFWNDEVLTDINSVVASIYSHMATRGYTSLDQQEL